MMCSVQLTGYGKANLVNYTKSGRPFWCEIQIQPIMSKDMYGDEQITHLLGTLVKTASLDMPKTSSCSTSPSDRGEREGCQSQNNFINRFEIHIELDIYNWLSKGASGEQALVLATAKVEVWVLGTAQATMEETAPLGTAVTTALRKWATNVQIHQKINLNQQRDPGWRTTIYHPEGS